MDRTNSRIAQAYGYAVCFITVIVMLIALKQVVDPELFVNIVDLGLVYLVTVADTLPFTVFTTTGTLPIVVSAGA